MQYKNGALIVRAPFLMGDGTIRAFVKANEPWIEKQKVREAKRLSEESEIVPYTEEELRTLMTQAKAVIPERVRYYAERMGVTYGRISFRKQVSRWGSCASSGNLSFNCLLAAMPLEVLDSVVVHELCHRKQMNHSAAFYKEVYRVYPEYDQWHSWLRKNGKRFIARLRRTVQ